MLCEDTRHSATLLDHYGIRTARKSLHEHNERERIGEVLALIAAGKAAALISDAGTPLLSDPGFPLVRAAREAGVEVFAVPGPSALLAALAIAGLPTDSFSFIGFLPAKFEARDLADLRGAIGKMETPAVLGWRLGAQRAADAVLLCAAILESPLPPGWTDNVRRGAAAVFPITAADLMPGLTGVALGERLKALQTRWLASDLRASRQDLLKP